MTVPGDPTAQPDDLPPELAPLRADDPAAIGPFRLVGRLGAGGMGTVYGGLDGADRCIAVKVVHARFAERSDYRERFAYEADLVRRIDAECAPAFLGADPGARTPWLATEFVPGRTLRAHLREFGPLEGAALLSFAAGTAEALAAVHGAGILHRDIKPGNVMLAPQGPRLLDFGIARAVEDTRTEQGLFGTPGWLAPEQMADVPASTGSDVFAWAGLVVYAAAGHGPYGEGDTQTLVARMRAGSVSSAGVPEELRPLVDRALSGTAQERPSAQECLEVVLALSGAQAGDEREPAAARERLRQLLAAAWRGFDAAGHRPEAWVASGVAAAAAGLAGGGAVAGAVAPGAASTAGTAGTAVGGAAGSAAGSAAAGVTVAAGGGTVAGMTTTTAVVVAALTAVTVTTGGWVAGRAATGQPVLPGTGGSTAPSSPSPDQSASAGTAVEYRGLRLRIPDDWQVHRQESTFDPVYSQQGPITDEWLLLQTDASQECGSPEWVYGHYECDRVMVFGPGGLSGASMGSAFSADGAFQPENQPYACDPTLSTSAEEPADSPVTAGTADIGGSSAQYREWRVSCIDAPGDGVTTAGPQVYYDQRLWYLAEAEILIVDNYGTQGLPGILSDAEMR